MTPELTIGDGADTVDGGDGSYTLNLNVIATAVADTLDVIFDGTAITRFEGGAVTGVELFTANLGAGTDTLTFAGTTAAITVDLDGRNRFGRVHLSDRRRERRRRIRQRYSHRSGRRQQHSDRRRR